MVRLDEANWIKAGIEMSDGEPVLSSVLTVGQSDWATGRYAGDPADFWLRVTVRDGVIRLQSLGGRKDMASDAPGHPSRRLPSTALDRCAVRRSVVGCRSSLPTSKSCQR